MPESGSRYTRILETIFRSHYRKGLAEFVFSRGEIEESAAACKIRLPKNLGDLIYSFRYRAALPESIRSCTPVGRAWVIVGAGQGRYRFVLRPDAPLSPNPHLDKTKVPDATPGLIAMYALSDEQALLARLRYNRLLDVFTGVACYSLQNHLRTFVPDVGQVETDEVYVGVDAHGAQYVFPVQAKGGRDKLSHVQVEQDVAMCALKFPRLLCRPVSAQFMEGGAIALFEFRIGESGPVLVRETHYRLVPGEEVTPEDLERYRIQSRPPTANARKA
jgi:hypothetical protein